MEHKNRAVILKVVDYGEADRIVTFFTEDFGKFRGMAKHAKKSKRRFGSGFEVGSVGNIRFNEKRGVELVRLEEFSVDIPSWKFTGSLARITSLHVAVELADKMLPLAHASKKRFSLLSRWVAFLCENEPFRKHMHLYFYKWLALSGIGPEIDRCVSCNESVDIKRGEYYINGSHGGVVCGACRRPQRGDVLVSAGLFEYLKHLKMGKALKTPANGSDSAFQNLIVHAIGCELKSLDVYYQCVIPAKAGI